MMVNISIKLIATFFTPPMNTGSGQHPRLNKQSLFVQPISGGMLQVFEQGFPFNVPTAG
jgi:hypothetical protein